MSEIMEFQQFMHPNGMHHVTSALAHPASNGLVERAVRTLKEGLSRMKKGSLMNQLSRFLFWYRNTPQQTMGVSPTELLIGRRLIGTGFGASRSGKPGGKSTGIPEGNP